MDRSALLHRRLPTANPQASEETQVEAMANDITESMQRVKKTLTQEIDRSLLSYQILERSTKRMRGANQRQEEFSGVLGKTRGAMKQLWRRERADQYWIMGAFGIFLASIAYILSQRLWMPPFWVILKALYTQVLALLNYAKSSSIVSPTTVREKTENTLASKISLTEPTYSPVTKTLSESLYHVPETTVSSVSTADVVHHIDAAPEDNVVSATDTDVIYEEPSAVTAENEVVPSEETETVIESLHTTPIEEPFTTIRNEVTSVAVVEATSTTVPEPSVTMAVEEPAMEAPSEETPVINSFETPSSATDLYTTEVFAEPSISETIDTSAVISATEPLPVTTSDLEALSKGSPEPDSIEINEGLESEPKVQDVKESDMQQANDAIPVAEESIQLEDVKQMADEVKEEPATPPTPAAPIDHALEDDFVGEVKKEAITPPIDHALEHDLAGEPAASNSYANDDFEDDYDSFVDSTIYGSQSGYSEESVPDPVDETNQAAPQVKQETPVDHTEL